ncbi:MAG: hypothetical protein ACOC9Y_05680, partial [Chloroflexota bacterium]
MPDRPVLEAVERTIIGKKVKYLRRDGKVPAIVYGTLVDEPIPVTLETKDLYRTYIDYGNISLIDVHLNGDVHTVYIRNVHQHPVTREPLHAELYAPNLTVTMSAAVPVILVGESPNMDGVVAQRRLERLALPQLQRLGRLFVVVAVEQHRGLTGPGARFGEDDRLAPGGQGGGVKAQVAQVIHQPRGAAVAGVVVQIGHAGDT